MGLGSGIRKKPVPDPGSRGQKGTGSRTAKLLRKKRNFPHSNSTTKTRVEISELVIKFVSETLVNSLCA